MTDRAPRTGLWGAPGQIRAEYVDDVAHASQTPSSHLSLSVRNSEASDTPTCQTRTQSVSALPDVWRSQLSLSSALSSITQDAASLCPGTSSVPRHSAPHVLLSHDTSPRTRRPCTAHSAAPRMRTTHWGNAAAVIRSAPRAQQLHPRCGHRSMTRNLRTVAAHFTSAMSSHPSRQGPCRDACHRDACRGTTASRPQTSSRPCRCRRPSRAPQRPGYTKIPFRYTARCP